MYPLLTREQLSSYTGVYTSDEIETTLRVELDGLHLVLRQRPNSTIILTPAGKDSFTSSLGTIRFIGNELSLHESRVWDLRFQRR
jgi:hypothetical protein